MDDWIRFWTALWLGWSDLSRRTIDLILCTTPTKQPTPEPAAAPDEQAETGAGEQQEKSPPEKTGKRKTPRTQGSPALRILSVGLALGFIYGLPWTTRIAIAGAVLWTITALVLGYLATRPTEKKPAPKQPSADNDGQEQGPAADTRHPSELLPLEHVAVLLHGAYTEGSGVHLAHLAETLTTTPLMGLPATPWKTGHVRALLTRHGIRVRAGVRVPPLGGREGVHRRDFPPLPPTGAVPPVVGDVAAGQSNNNNDHNTTPPPFQVVQDPTNPHRHHIHHTH
ncbi:hypothetical protein [Streptomyces bacillaris]|uniref:hypothetical protein n=1 Tax=Streptomyces bacillaris TaxID=68179 RepID=UPI0034605E9B